jgi:signal transduction histidine kinase
MANVTHVADDDPTDRDGAAAPLGWPLVERRRPRQSAAPDGVERRQRPSATRLEQLAEANELLVALNEVAQRLPDSLDLDAVLDSTVEQIRAIVGGEIITVLLRDSTDGTYVPVRGRGSAVGAPMAQLPAAAHAALRSSQAVRSDDLLSTGLGLVDDAVCGLYVAAATRSQVVAVVAVESRVAAAFDDSAAEMLTALAEPFAIAIDNARLFRRVRTVAADEERRRLARDLHDRIGSSVALLGFEVDRIIGDTNRVRTQSSRDDSGTGANAGSGDEAAGIADDRIETSLRELRAQITTVVGDVRETLNDLRTEITDDRDLATTLRGFLDRLSARSGLRTHFDVDVTLTLPRPQERELWHIALESLVNVERHAQATTVTVGWQCDAEQAVLVISDDGKGLQSDAARADSYGLTGMRERAAAIGARIEVDSEHEAGTTVTIRLGHSLPTTQGQTETQTGRTP